MYILQYELKPLPAEHHEAKYWPTYTDKDGHIKPKKLSGSPQIIAGQKVGFFYCPSPSPSLLPIRPSPSLFLSPTERFLSNGFWRRGHKFLLGSLAFIVGL